MLKTKGNSLHSMLCGFINWFYYIYIYIYIVVDLYIYTYTYTYIYKPSK